MSDIEIEIDGKKLSAKSDAMVIQVADEAGIYIPRFCYHKHLSIAANCRMCLVEVEKAPKPLPACATPVMPGMKVFTRSAKALAAQKAVMEFLLINHPLDCPICDQGGECELQDLSLGYGSSESFYTEGKRAVKDKDIGPLIETEMTRCIHCTRCVRFGAEVAGMRELGATGRGGHMEIGTYIDHAMQSEVSGNVIDLCPVGALTSKPFRFTARPWELEQRPTVSPHDCIGSNLNAHTRYGKVMRVVPRENSAINQTWISDRDRYSYQGLYHADRIGQPKIKRQGSWQTVDWQTALLFTQEGLQKVLNSAGADQFAALASPNSTVEEFYLLQQLMRGVGSPHVDHRLRQVDFSDQAELPACPSLGLKIADIEQCDVIVLIGSNIQKEQPVFSLRIRKAAAKGAKVIVINPVDYEFHFDVAYKEIVAPDEMAAKIINAAPLLAAAKKPCILLGALALNHSSAAALRQAAAKLGSVANASIGYLTEGANSAGGWLAGAVPHRGAMGSPAPKAGLDAQSMLTDPRKAYLLLNVEPDLDCANPVAARDALKQADFVVSLSLYDNSVITEHADVILPIAQFTETAGTYVNAEEEWQSFQGVANAYEQARPAWKILRVLGNLLQVAGMEYQSAEEVKAAVCSLNLLKPNLAQAEITTVSNSAGNGSLVRIGEIPLYATDSLVRRSPALAKAQEIRLGELKAIRIHPLTAAKLNLTAGKLTIAQQGTGSIRLPLLLDERLAERGVWIPGGIAETAGLSELFGKIELVQE